jgi:hypothetical protein
VHSCVTPAPAKIERELKAYVKRMALLYKQVLHLSMQATQGLRRWMVLQHQQCHYRPALSMQKQPEHQANYMRCRTLSCAGGYLGTRLRLAGTRA